MATNRNAQYVCMWKGKWNRACSELLQGGHVIKCHIEIRNVTATLLQEVAHNVRTEPILQPLTGEVLRGRCANTKDAGRVDVKCTGFWNVHQDAFLDVRVFNPLASSNRNKPIKTVYQHHEKEKR